MEHINQLLAWQEQLEANPGAEYVDIDVARRLIKHGIEAIESARRADRKAREECLSAVKKLLTAPECCDEYDRSVNDGLKEAMSAIRATIKDNQT